MNAWQFFNNLFGNKRALNFSFLILLIIVLGLLSGLLTGRIQLVSDAIKIISVYQDDVKAEEMDIKIKKLEGKVLNFKAFDIELHHGSNQLEKYRYGGKCKINISEDYRLVFEGKLQLNLKANDSLISNEIMIKALLVDYKENYLHFQYDLYDGTRWGGTGIMMVYYRELEGNIIRGYSLGAAAKMPGRFKVTSVEGIFEN